MKKKGNKKMPTPRHKLIHNPIPTSLFLSSPQCISCSQFNVKMFFSNAFTTNKLNSEQRCRDGVMNEFVSWCRHLLVSFLFRALTSLHPPSFHRNDFSTCIPRYHQQGNGIKIICLHRRICVYFKLSVQIRCVYIFQVV